MPLLLPQSDSTKRLSGGNMERIVTTWLLCESMTGAVANHVSTGTDTFQRIDGE